MCRKNKNLHLCVRIRLVQSELPSQSDTLSILNLTVVFSVGSLFPVCNLYFHFFLTSLGQHTQFHHLLITPQWFLCSYPLSINEHASGFFFFVVFFGNFTYIQFGPTIHMLQQKNFCLTLIWSLRAHRRPVHQAGYLLVSVGKQRRWSHICYVSKKWCYLLICRRPFYPEVMHCSHKEGPSFLFYSRRCD